MKFHSLKGDIFGGITAGIVALPLALAFGVQSGLGATAGLYGAMFLGFFAAIFGGTPTQVSGPTGPMTIVAASLVAVAVAKYASLESALGVILLTFFLTGVFLVVFGLLQIGKYIKYIPFPVLSGFMSGIGVIIILLQIFPAMGLVSPSKVIDVLIELPGALPEINYTALAITGGTILLIYLIPLINRSLPATLISLILVSGVSYLLSLDAPLIGSLPRGLPVPALGSFTGISFDDLRMALLPALMLAGLGTIDTLLTSVVADNITRTRHNSNRELIGQGIGNMVASLFGGIPGAGATMRTVVNIKSGGKTRLSGATHALFLLVILLGLGRFVSFIPLAALSGVLITVGTGIIERRGIRSLFSMPKSDAFILVIVLVLTVFVDLLEAVAIGMVIASLVFMRKASSLIEESTTLTRVEKDDHEMAWGDEANLHLDHYKQVYIKRLEGPLFFGVANRIMERITKIPPDARVVIFRMKNVPYMDLSGLYALEEVIREMQRLGITVALTMTQSQPMHLFRKNKFVPDVVPEKFMFQSIEECADWLKDYFRNRNTPPAKDGT